MVRSGEVIEPAPFTRLEDSAPSRRHRGPSLLLLILVPVLLLFVLAMWFLLTARSVSVEVEPANTALSIDGGLHFRLGPWSLFRPGNYQLRAEAPGYYPQQRELTVDESDRQQLSIRLQPLPGLLDIVSQPSGAQVLIDEKSQGFTPLQQLSVAAGEHQMTLDAPRYLPLQTTLVVSGRGQLQQFSLALQPAWAAIHIDSTPSAATVLVDGEVAGRTPAQLEILQGEHQIGLQLPGYRDWQQTLQVSAGVAQVLPKVTLQAAAGILSLYTEPSRANVTLDGEYQGQTPLSLVLSPGDRHQLAVFKPGYRRVNRELALQPEQRRELRLVLAAQLAEVRVEVQPEDAEILVDGVSQGRGSRALRLPVFEQTLEVRRADYRSQQRRFTPRADLHQIIQVQLVTEAEAQVAALPREIDSPGGPSLGLFSPGDFTMGASRREPGRRANEVLHPVSLTRRFYFSYREVSNGQFRKFRPTHDSGQVSGNGLNRDRQPVVMVSWNDAAQYCNWLSEADELPPFYLVEDGVVTGFDAGSTGYRLPSEAEWAWLARYRPQGLLKFPWGDEFPPRQVLANYADASAAYITGRTVSGYNDGHAVSAPVASFPADSHGIYDLGGNVAEWVHDVYSLASTRGTVARDPLGTQTGNHHVIRGASWAHGSFTELRLSFRDYGQAGRNDVGFRIARYAEKP